MPFMWGGRYDIPDAARRPGVGQGKGRGITKATLRKKGRPGRR